MGSPIQEVPRCNLFVQFPSSRFEKDFSREIFAMSLDRCLERRRSSQDIFERIDNFRGGEGGAVKLKDLIRFLRAVCENIDQNFKVTLLLNQLSLNGEKVVSLREAVELLEEVADAGWDGNTDIRLEELTERDLSLILEDFEDGPDQVEHSQRKIYKPGKVERWRRKPDEEQRYRKRGRRASLLDV